MYYAPPHAAYAPDAPPPPPPPFYYGAPMPPAYYEPPEPPFVARRRDQPMHAGQGCVKRARWGAQHRIHEHFADGFPDLARRFVKVRASSDRRFEYDLGTRRFPSKRLGAIGVRHLNALFRRLDRAIGTRDASLVHELRAMLTDVLEDWRFRHHWRAGGGGGGDDDGGGDSDSDDDREERTAVVVSFEEEGDKPDARGFLERALAKDPDDRAARSFFDEGSSSSEESGDELGVSLTARGAEEIALDLSNGAAP